MSFDPPSTTSSPKISSSPHGIIWPVADRTSGYALDCKSVSLRAWSALREKVIILAWVLFPARLDGSTRRVARPFPIWGGTRPHRYMNHLRLVSISGTTTRTSYRAAYDHDSPLSEWAYTTTQYGQNVFVSSVQRANIFATQFHPEKYNRVHRVYVSLPPGYVHQDVAFHQQHPLSVEPPSPAGHSPRTAWQSASSPASTYTQTTRGIWSSRKGDQYDVREKFISSLTTTTTTVNVGGALRNLRKPVHLASRYFAQGADDICLLNITSSHSSPLLDQPMLAAVRAAAAEVFVPLTHRANNCWMETLGFSQLYCYSQKGSNVMRKRNTT